MCFSLISSWGSCLLEALAGTTCSTTKLSSAQSAQSVATKMTTWRQGNDKGKPHNCALMIFSNYMIWVKILKFDRLPFHQEYLPSLGSKQSQRAITLLFTRRGPSYCFPLPPLWTHRHSEYVEKVHVKNVHLLISLHVEEGKTGIFLHHEILLFETDL